LIPLQEFVDRLRREIQDEVDSRSVPVLKGSCADFGDYMAAAGEIRGLAKAREVLDELIRRVNSGE